MFEKINSKNRGEDIDAPAPPPPVRGASTAAGHPQASAPAPVSHSGHRNVLLPDVEIKGTVQFEDDLIVQCKIEGEIRSSGALSIGETAKIKAEINCGAVVVNGKVHGDITASEAVDLQPNAEVIGDIKTKVLTMAAGAVFVGKSTVGAPTEAPAPAKKGEPAKNKAPDHSSSAKPAKVTNGSAKPASTGS